MDEHTQDQNLKTHRPRLGRGLSALLGNHSVNQRDSAEGQPPQVASTDEIHVDLIERNPFQPRQEFAADGLQELADSIKKQGVLQPLIVRPHDDRYQLIAGERRLLAARQAGRDTVPCRVVEADDRTVCEIAIDENLKRRDLSVLEKAQAFQDYLNRFQCSVEELAGRLSLDRSTITNMIRLLGLSEAARLALNAGEISAGHARAILSLDEAQQQDMCQQIKSQGLSVRATEKAVRTLQQPEQNSDVLPFPGEQHAPEKTEHVQSLEQQLQEQFGVKVTVKLKTADSGQVIIPFHNNDDFERIVQNLRRAA